MKKKSSLEVRLKKFVASDHYSPLKRHELADALQLAHKERHALRPLLTDMRERGEIVLLKKNRWAPAGAGKLIKGRLEISRKGGAFVIPDDDRGSDLFVPPHQLANALHGDRVMVSCSEKRSKNGKGNWLDEARIVSVIQRARKVCSGILCSQGKKYFIKPDAKAMPQHVMVRVTDETTLPPIGNKVLLTLDPWRSDAKQLSGTIAEDFGDPESTPGQDILALYRDRGFNHELPEEAEQQAQAIPHEAANEQSMQGREDLRKIITCTIDPPDAKDFDDALSIEADGNGGYWLGVHIADVPAFVAPDSPIDIEAQVRCTSTYLVDRTLPMLPKHLTNDACSLLPQIDRLTHSCMVHLDANAEMLEFQTYRSVIHSDARLTYDQVQSFFEGNKVPEISAKLGKRLQMLRKLAVKLRKERATNGAIEMSMPEIKCELDAAGTPLALRRKEPSSATQLVEEFMLLANRLIAAKIVDAQFPGMYRVHEAPSDEQWERMGVELQALGIKIKPKTPQDISKVAAEAASTDKGHTVALTMLRQLKQARYSSKADGHFGLGFEIYTHFTSPIRRYPDLLIHRILSAIENSEEPPYTKERLSEFATECSTREREAMDLERDSIDMKRCQYYADLQRQGKIGPWKANIVGFLNKGLLVELCDSLQRGLIPFDALEHDYYSINAARTFARGSKSGTMYRLGDIIEVELNRIDEKARQIDFRRPKSSRSKSRTPARKKPPHYSKKGRRPRR